jgi:hypothetical protein
MALSIFHPLVFLRVLFQFVVPDGHNGTVRSRLIPVPVVATLALPLLAVFLIQVLSMVTMTLSTQVVCIGWPQWRCPYLVIRFLCGGYNSTSTPVMFLAPVDQ